MNKFQQALLTVTLLGAFSAVPACAEETLVRFFAPFDVLGNGMPADVVGVFTGQPVEEYQIHDWQPHIGTVVKKLMFIKKGEKPISLDVVVLEGDDLFPDSPDIQFGDRIDTVELIGIESVVLTPTSGVSETWIEYWAVLK